MAGGPLGYIDLGIYLVDTNNCMGGVGGGHISQVGNPTPGPIRTRSRKGVGEGEVEHLPYLPYQGRVEKRPQTSSSWIVWGWGSI